MYTGFSRIGPAISYLSGGFCCACLEARAMRGSASVHAVAAVPDGVGGGGASWLVVGRRRRAGRCLRRCLGGAGGLAWGGASLRLCAAVSG
jgi:hypothetical protein